MFIGYILGVLTFIFGCAHPELWYMFIFSIGYCLVGVIGEIAIMGRATHKRGTNYKSYYSSDKEVK